MAIRIGAGFPWNNEPDFDLDPSFTATGNKTFGAMRYFFIILLLNIPCTIGATLPAPMNNFENAGVQFSLSARRTTAKQRFLKRFAQKMIQKRLKKMANATGRSRNSYGLGLAICGLALGLLGAFSFVFISYTAFYPPLILGLGGLVLSIWGLVKGNGWHDNGLTRRLAIIGIVLNVLVLLGAVALIGSF